MEVKEAKYILAIARYKSINKAAKALFISQPSLSKYLQNMEYRMGGRMFSRIHNEYIPTYMGERYISYAKKIIETEEEWNKEFNDIKKMKKGVLNIALPIVRSAYLIPETISVFHEKYPGIGVNIYEAASSVERSLEDESIDAVIYNVDRYPKDLDYQVLGKSEVVLVVEKNHPLTGKAVPKEGFYYPWIDIREVEGEPCIMLHEGQVTQNVADRILSEKKVMPDVWMRTRSSEVAIRMAARNMGITFASEGYVQYLEMSDRLQCLSMGDQQMCTSLIAAYRPGQYISVYLQEYMNIIKNILFKNKIQSPYT